MLATVVCFAAPPVPEPMAFIFNYQDVPVANLKITITYGTEIIEKYTNDNGGIVIDIGTGSPDFTGTYSSLTVDCGTNCKRTYDLNTIDTPYQDTIKMETSPAAASVCDCPSSGGGGGGGGCYYTTSKCLKLFPDLCPTTVCPTVPVCPTCKVCEDKVCPECFEKVCPDCEVCPECEELVTEDNNLMTVIFSIIAFLIGGGTMYIGFGTANKVKVKKVNGVNEVWHQHPLVSGYHSINTIHRTEPHKKGELIPKYQKDSTGKWKYAG